MQNNRVNKVITNPKQIDAVLSRSVAEILPKREQLREIMMAGERLRMYVGMDGTAPALHLGHAQQLLVLEDFRRLGHEVIWLIGDFTSMIGDPTDKSSTRVCLTKEDVQKNIADWQNQVKNIADFDDSDNPTQIKYNSAWLAPLNFEEIVDLASNFTVQQMLERDMFAKRLREGKPIHLHEFLYPLMQGFDSVAMDVDIELCGTDQTFNALAGRTLLQKVKGKNKFVVATNLIADEKTGQLMSKSNGTGIFLNLPANEMFGAVMSLGDGMIAPLAMGCTRLSLTQIEEMRKAENPRDAKIELAHEIVRIFYGKEAADEAQKEFANIFSKGGKPDEMPKFDFIENESILSFLVRAEMCESKGEAKRLVKQNAVSVNNEKVTDEQKMMKKGDEIRAGKRRWGKII